MSSSKFGLDSLLQSRGKSLQTGESLRIKLVKGPTRAPDRDPVSEAAPYEGFPQILKFGESVVKPNFEGETWKRARLYQQNVPKAQDDSDEEAMTTPGRGYKRWQPPKRQWILQEHTDFLETMIAKRQRKPLNTKVSSRYEGTEEANSSHYVVLQLSEDQSNVEVVPLSKTNAFSQPNKRQVLSMTQAEQAIQDQRGKMTRFMMHKGKKRLLGKFTEGQEEEDDVMGDVGFKKRKGGGGGARKELLDLADDGIKVDGDGVLGGQNDAEFGGKRHFGRFHQEKKMAAKEKASTSAGNDGLAMADDFYQRDVKAEYDELDYDADELFDDDDVDLGEGEVAVADGFANDDELDEEDEEIQDAPEGAEGLATVAGFRHMLAKARGETVDPSEEDTEKEAADQTPQKPKKPPTRKPTPVPEDPLASLQQKQPKHTGVELDENGQRLVTLEAIQREIWLHHGSIRVKRLMKIFDISKKASQERRGKFRDLIKELCIMKQDAVDGNMLVLKQHYSNMG